MNKQEAIQLIKEFITAYLLHQIDKIDKFVDHTVSAHNLRDHVRLIDEFRFASRYWSTAFPDATVDFHQFLWDPEEASLFILASLTGTQSGWLGDMYPTNKQITLRIQWIIWFSDDKIVRFLPILSFMELLASLGHIEVSNIVESVIKSYLKELQKEGMIE